MVRYIGVRTSEERFWSKVEFIPFHECWEWNAALPQGRGRIRIKKNNKWVDQMAYQFSWELENGPLPKNLQINHTCDTPSCVRPEHLYAGSQTENMQDMNARGRHWRMK